MTITIPSQAEFLLLSPWAFKGWLPLAKAILEQLYAAKMFADVFKQACTKLGESGAQQKSSCF